MADELLQIRVTADFKEAEGAFLRLAKVATSFESNIRSVSASLNKEFNKIVGSAELFGNSTNVIKDKMDALKNAMVSLMTLGFQPMNPEVQKLKKQYDELANSLTPIAPKIKQVGKDVAGAGNSVKKSSQQWTSWALVLQDLPYGFRGIQNNLPALIGGIAGAAGAIYFIASALIAFTTAYEKEITAFIYGISGVDSAQQKLNTTVADGIGQAKSETATNASLLIIINDVTKSTKERTDALELLKEKYKANIELQKTDITDGKKLIEITNKISDALLRKARAETFSKLIAEEEANVYKLQNAKGEQVVKSLGFLGTTYGILKSAGNGVTTSMNIVNDAFDSQANAIKASKDNISIYTNKLNENTLAQIKNDDAATIGTKAAKDPKKESKQKVSDYNEKEAAAEFDFYKNSLFQAEFYFNKLNEIRKTNALMKGVIDGASINELLSIQKTYEQYSINFAQQTEDKKFAIRQQSFQRQKTLTEKHEKDVYDGQVKYASDYIKVLDIQLKTELKLHKNSVELQKEDIRNKIKQIQFAMFFAAGNQKAFDAFGQKLKELQGQLGGFGDISKQVADILHNSLVTGIQTLGTTIGESLATGKFDFTALGNVFADALTTIGNALIAYALTSKAAIEALKAGPLGWGIALGAGILAVAAGAFLKSKVNEQKSTAFANGGIVSGPTMGLVGEYPGAKSNPEVIAPLDKLKSMIGGGGGGQFTLRGQDLLLAVNRAQKASNLKGQNISLA